MSPIWKKPIHAKLPHTTVLVATFILTLISSAVVAYINSAFGTGCSTTSTTSGNFTIVSITSTGTCSWSVPNYVNTVDVLVVGGGGGGGSNVGGGGAGGGVTTQTNFSVTPGSSISVTVGSGGAGGINNGNGSVGGGSSFSTVTAVGGDYGRAYSGSANGGTGSGGGGSGGRGSLTNTGLTQSGSAGTSSSVTGLTYGGGGGGGAYHDDAVGTTLGGTGVNGGANGGTRSATFSFVTRYTYTNTHPVAATANTGGGGGGGVSGGFQPGSAGGSGIVVIKFISECSPTISTNISFNYRYSFTTAGTCNWVSPSSTTNFKVLVVGGGGGGGFDAGGGGGGGGIAYNSNYSVSANSIFTITIGSGGSGGTSGSKTGTTGATSTLIRSGSTLASALGGTGGGGCNWNGSNCQGANSNGVGGNATASGWTVATGSNGGRGFCFSSTGASCTGGSTAGNGVAGTSVFSNSYSGGGGGGYDALGGTGGGGNGGSNATSNTGGGGGGGTGSANGGSGGSGVIQFINDFDDPTISWSAPSSTTYINSASYTPDWTLSDSSSGILSSSGTAKRQYTSLTNGVCGTSWTTEATQTKASSTSVTSERCYRWTFDSTLATDAIAPTDNIGSPVITNLTSPTVIYDPIPTVTSVTSSSSDGVYTFGQTLSFTITFSESVTVTGNPQLTLETGLTDQVATCSQATSPSTTLTCSMTIARDSNSNDLDYASTSALTLNGGTIVDYSNNAILTLPSLGSANSIAGSKSIIVTGSSSVGANGGTISVSGNYVIHTFTSNGTFYVANSSSGNVQVLAVGGGGGGAAGVGSGGGGGAVIEQTLSLTANTSYAITIGQGGAGNATQASSGTSTTFSSLLTAPGGTGGKSRFFCQNGLGGSPGGGDGAKTGNIYPENNSALGNCTGKTQNGSNGTLSAITGNYYGGGGGRGGETSVAAPFGTGGLGGGGNGGVAGSNGSNGTTNTGGGAGGGGEGSSLGGTGGSGIVVVRYLIDSYVDVPTITSSQNGTTTNSSTTITFTGEAGATFECKLNSGTYSSCSSPYNASGLSSGSNTFYVRQTDSYSNLSDASSITWTVDATAPSISSFSTTTTTPTNSSTLVYSLVFSESVTGLTTSDFTVSGWSLALTSGSGAGPYEITLTRTTATDGNVSLVLSDASVIDGVNNNLSANLSSRTAQTIVYDATNPTQPTVSLNTSSCDVKRNTSAVVSFSATDATAGIAGYRYTTDGTTPTSSSTSGSGLTISSEGVTALKVRALDNAGNLSTTATCSIDIDSIIPIGNWYSQPSSPTSLTSFSYTLVFDQVVTGLTTGDFSISGTATGCQISLSGSGTNYTVTLSSCSQGTIQITLSANSISDEHGNLGPAVNLSASTLTRSVVSSSISSASVQLTYGTAASSTAPVSGSGGLASLSYSISPTLPAGLAFNTSTGAITGTPSTKSNSTSYSITVTDGLVSSSSSFTLEVQAKTLTITANSQSVNYLDSYTSSITATGLATGDLIDTVSYSYTGSDNDGNSYSSTSFPTEAGSYTATPTAITLSSGSLSNYDINYVGQSLTINKISQSSFTLNSSNTTVYYQESATLSTSGGNGTGSVSYAINAGAPCSISSSTITTTGIGSCVVTATKASSKNYNATSTNLTITAAAFPISVSANDVTVSYGESIAPSISNTNLKNSDQLSSATYTYQGTGVTNYGPSSTKPTNAGTYSITPNVTSLSVGTFSNYSLSFTAGTLTIGKINQSVLTISSTSGTFGSNLTLTSSGGSGTGTVTFVAITGTASSCSVSGSTLTAGSAGTCLVTATKASDTNYLSSSSSQTTVTFAKANQSTLSVVLASSSIEHRQTTTISSSGGSGTGDVTFAATGDCTISGTTISTLQSGSCAITASKAADANYNSAISSASILTINPDSIVPTAIITTSEKAYTNSNSLSYTITFSELISGLTASDFVSTGWTKTLTGSGLTYYLTLSAPDVSVSDGTVSVVLSSGSFTDGTNLNSSSFSNTSVIRDTTSPTSTPVISSSPELNSTSSTANFVFTGAGINESYECRINSNAFQSCTSNYQITGLSSGNYSMDLRITDLAGNYTSLTSYSWTINLPQSSASNAQTNRPVQILNLPSSKPSLKPDSNRERNLLPVISLPQFLKPWLEKIPFISQESLLAKELQPTENDLKVSEIIQLVQGKSESIEIKVIDQNNEIFDPQAEITIENYDAQPVAIEVLDKEGNYLRIKGLDSKVSEVDLENLRFSIEVGSKILIQSPGNLPQSQFSVWLRSKPLFIGQGFANNLGIIEKEFSIPLEASVGLHRFEIKKFNSSKKIESTFVPVLIKEKTKKQGMILVDENPVEKYLNQLTFIIMIISILILILFWTVISLIRDSRKLKAQLRN